MSVDLNSFIETGKKMIRVKSELERLNAADKRIYEISRMIPEEEGFELLTLYRQAIEDTRKIQKVIHEK